MKLLQWPGIVASCFFEHIIKPDCMKWREKHEGFAGQRLVVLPRPALTTALQNPLLKQLLPTDAGYYPKAKIMFACVKKGVRK